MRGLAAALTLGVAGALAGCQPATVERGASMPLPLTGPQITERLAGNTLYRKGIKGLARWEYASYHDAGGTMSAKASWIGGADTATGHWEVTSNDLYCRTWSNHWARGERGCFRVFDSSADGTLILDHVSGNPGDSEQYSYQVLVGNPHGL